MLHTKHVQNLKDTFKDLSNFLVDGYLTDDLLLDNTKAILDCMRSANVPSHHLCSGLLRGVAGHNSVADVAPTFRAQEIERNLAQVESRRCTTQPLGSVHGGRHTVMVVCIRRHFRERDFDCFAQGFSIRR